METTTTNKGHTMQKVTLSNYKEVLGEDLTKYSWISICVEYELSEEFMEKFKAGIYWEYICVNYELSEEFILRNIDVLDWEDIAIFQRLSEKFIEENIEKIPLKWIVIAQKHLPEEFINKIKDIKMENTMYNTIRDRAYEAAEAAHKPSDKFVNSNNNIYDRENSSIKEYVGKLLSKEELYKMLVDLKLANLDNLLMDQELEWLEDNLAIIYDGRDESQNNKEWNDILDNVSSKFGSGDQEVIKKVIEMYNAGYISFHLRNYITMNV